MTPQEIERAAVALRDGFASVQLPLDDDGRGQLCGFVQTYVDAVKTMGWTPERTIIAVKAIASDAGFTTSARWAVAPTQVTPTRVDELLIDAVGWCIKRYFTTAPSVSAE